LTADETRTPPDVVLYRPGESVLEWVLVA